MQTYQCLEYLNSLLTDELVVTNLGGVARELQHLNDRPGNLYRPYMGFTIPLALGLALALPHRRVIAVDGDGSLLMGLSVLPALAAQSPSNLIVIVMDNEAYQATGGPPTFTARATDLARMAAAAGVPNTSQVKGLREFTVALDAAFAGSATSFINAKVAQATEAVPYSTLDGIENKYRFVRHIEATEHTEILKKPRKQPL